MSNPARDHALQLLDARDFPGWPAGEIARRFATTEPPDDVRDVALAEQIYVGVVKNLLALRRWTQQLSERPPHKLDGLVQKILAIGLYQVAFLERIPVASAVDEAVEQAKEFGRSGACGLINAVMRKSTRVGPPTAPDKLAEPHTYALHVLSHPRDVFQRLLGLYGRDDALRVCEHDNAEPPTLLRLNEGVTIEKLIERASASGAKVARASAGENVASPGGSGVSFPDGHGAPETQLPLPVPGERAGERGDPQHSSTIVSLAKISSAESAVSSLTEFADPSPLPSPRVQGEGVNASARTAGVDTSARGVQGRAPARGDWDEDDNDVLTLAPHEQSGIVVVSHGAPRSLFASWADAGLAQVQDATAALVVPACDVQPGMRVLDRCAGVGTKTMQLAALVGPEGSVAAVDPSPQRSAMLERIIHSRKMKNIAVHRAAKIAHLVAFEGKQFDRILADVPCSNSGVLARRPEARYAQDAQTLASLERLQMQILLDSADFVAPGGLLIYSTCSIWREENEWLVERFLKASTIPFEKITERSTAPSFDQDPTSYRDGGFHAVLRMKG